MNRYKRIRVGKQRLPVVIRENLLQFSLENGQKMLFFLFDELLFVVFLGAEIGEACYFWDTGESFYELGEVFVEIDEVRELRGAVYVMILR